MEKNGRKIIKYSITALIGAVIVVAVFLSENLFVKTDNEDIFKILCDGFFVAGFLLFAFGLLVIASAHGAFDAFGFLFSQLFITHNWSFSRRFKDRETYAEYVERKNGNRPRAPKNLLLVGAAYLTVSFVFLFIYLGYAS